MKLTACIPQQSGDIVCTQISVTFTEEVIDNHVVCYAVYNEISDELLQKKEEYYYLKETENYFEWILNEYMDNVYVSDMNTIVY